MTTHDHPCPTFYGGGFTECRSCGFTREDHIRFNQVPGAAPGPSVARSYPEPKQWSEERLAEELGARLKRVSVLRQDLADKEAALAVERARIERVYAVVSQDSSPTAGHLAAKVLRALQLSEEDVETVHLQAQEAK